MRRGEGLLGLGVAMAAAMVLAALFAPWLAPFDPLRAVSHSFGEPLPPGAVHWFGTDELGRDVLSRVLLGARLSLVVAGAATALALVVGVTLGLVAGYGGRWVDGLLMRFGDVFVAFPSMLLAIAIATLFEPSLLSLLLVIGMVSWTPVARTIRSEVLSLRQRDYVRAGEALGAGATRVMVRHLLPNVAPTILTLAAVSVSTTVLLEAGLSYLGLGVPVPAPSWGRMISDSFSYVRVAPWLVAFPGLAIVWAVLAFNLIAYGLMRGASLLRLRLRRALATVLVAALLSACARAVEPPPPGILRTSTVTDVPTLDPAAGYDTTSWRFEQMLFSTLLDYDDDGRLVAEGAESWEVDPTGTIYTFRLAPRLRFSSGRRVVAADVKYSIERVLDPATRSQGAQYFAGIEGGAAFTAGRATEVRGIEVEGDDVVRIRLGRFDPIFAHVMALQFAAIVPREVVEEFGEDFSSHPVGSGPFQLERWQRGQRLSLRRNPHYFRAGEPRLEGIEHLVGVNEQLEWLKYEAGELDIADIPSSEYPLVMRDPRYRDRLVSKTAMRTTYLGINCGVPPFDDARVRRAVSHALDREKALALLNHRGVAATGLVPPGIAGWDPEAPVPGYDPEASRALLRQAGLAEGFATTLWVRTDETQLRLAQSYQQDLAEVGIRARIRNLSWASFLEMIRRPGMAPLFMLGWEADFPDASNYLEVLLHSRNVDSNNYSFFADPEFDHLVDQAAVTLDPDARLDLLRRAEQHMLPLSPMTPLFYPVEVQAVGPRVRNYRLNPLRPPRFERVEVVG